MTAELARAGGVLGAAGLGLALVARGRLQRLTGLGGWALGAVLIAVYLAPKGHRPLLAAAAVLGIALAVAAAALLRRWPWLLPLAALACVPARIHVTVGSTAANLLVLGRAAMRLPVFRSVVAKRSYRLAAGSGHHAYRWKNLNPLLGRYPGAIGIKPGYTGAAGQCLLFEATRHGHTVIGVTLHSPGSISSVNPADATRILNWAFSHLG